MLLILSTGPLLFFIFSFFFFVSCFRVGPGAISWRGLVLCRSIPEAFDFFLSSTLCIDYLTFSSSSSFFYVSTWSLTQVVIFHAQIGMWRKMLGRGGLCSNQGELIDL